MGDVARCAPTERIPMGRHAEDKSRRVIIYTRYSDDNQRKESCADQERECRRYLERLNVRGSRIQVISDAAISGTKDDRPGFVAIQQLIDKSEIEILIVDDQSRFSRGLNVKALIQDLVYHGGRFISVNEGTDTARPGWQETVGFAELRHSMSSTDTARRIRRGQVGRILDGNGSLGDLPFGYRSRFASPDWQQQIEAGQRPKKEVYIYEPEAEIVRWIFNAYLHDGMSVNGIARELNARGVPKGKRSKKKAWSHESVRHMLTRQKYIGVWHWGRTETVRDSKGRIRQQRATRQEPVVVDRPALRIIDHATWSATQKKYEANAAKARSSGANRLHPKHEFPSFNLGGLVTCARCGRRLNSMVQKQYGRFFYCDNHYNGTCDMRRWVNVDVIRRALYGFLAQVCQSSGQWIKHVREETQKIVSRNAMDVPRRIDADQARLQQIRSKIDNLVDQMATGQAKAVIAKVKEYEDEAESIETRLRENQQLTRAKVVLPDDRWFAAELARLPTLLEQPSPAMAQLLKRLVIKAEVFESSRATRLKRVLCLRVAVKQSQVMLAVLSDDLRQRLAALNPNWETMTPTSMEFDLSQPTKTERLGPEIQKLRALGAKNSDIARQLSISTTEVVNMWTRWKRWNGIVETKIPLWQKWGERVRDLLAKGMGWNGIASTIGLSRSQCISLFTRWKEYHGASDKQKRKWEIMGPEIHKLRESGMTYAEVAKHLGDSRGAIVAVYRRWSRLAGVKKVNVCRHLRTKTARLGPVVEELRQRGFTWREIGEKLKLHWQAANGLHRHWIRCGRK